MIHFVDVESSFQFSPDAEFISLLYVHITLASDTEPESLCFPQLPLCYKHVESISIQMAFKRVIA